MSDWPRKVTLGVDADGNPVEILVVDEEVGSLLDERTAYWAAHPRADDKGPVWAALAEIVWAGRQEGPIVEMFGGPGTGWCLKLRSLQGRRATRAEGGQS
jgi:hypothetical protein